MQLFGYASEKGQKRICPLFELKEFLYCECIVATLLQNRVQQLKIFVIGQARCSILFCKVAIQKTESMRKCFYYNYVLMGLLRNRLTELGGNDFQKTCLIQAQKLHPVVKFLVFPVIFETTAEALRQGYFLDLHALFL